MVEESRSNHDNSPSAEVMPLREIASRTVTGSTYNVAAHAITLVLGFVRSVLLARILSPEDVGIVALALVLVNLIMSIAGFGLNAALIQRETAESEAVSTHFVLRVGLTVIGLLITIICIPLFNHLYPNRPLLVPVVLALSIVNLINAITSTPIVLLKRRLVFRRLAILDVASSVMMLLTAPLLASLGFGPWSLVLGEHLAGALTSTAGIWLYRRPWRPSLRFDLSIARQYLRFGWHILVNMQITYLLDQFDDFWTGTVLGSAAVGFYSKAYEFARYPRRIVAKPLEPVFFSAYARLQSDRRRLSQAYFRLNSIVVRLGFLFSLVLILVTPEFVELLLTDKWLPMVNAFRLMIVYTLLDPLIVTAGQLVIAVGEPQTLTRIKLLQLAVFVPSVVISANLWGIEGVAIAADLMLLVGIVFILHSVRRFVDFSLRRLFAYPTLALVLGGVGGWLAGALIGPGSLLFSLLTKAVTASFIYSIALVVFEHVEYRRNLETVLNLLGLDRWRCSHRPA